VVLKALHSSLHTIEVRSNVSSTARRHHRRRRRLPSLRYDG
jgi:hypothetical protein